MVQNYGVLKGRPARWERGLHATNWHFQILVRPNGVSFRMAVNVLSTECEEDLECRVIPDFSYSGRAGLEALNEGFTSLAPAGGSPHPLALDYVRGNLFDETQFKSIAPVTIGTDNDLNDIIDDTVARSYAPSGVVNDPPMSPVIYAFGSAWSPKTPTEQDQYFGFVPSRGVHNVHMNQGNPKILTKPCQTHHSADNGTWTDGGLLIDPGDGTFTAVFLKFATQSWQTDDHGNPV